MDRDEQRRAAGRALIAKFLADAIAGDVKSSRRALEPTLIAGEKVRGVLADGTVIGNVQITEPPASVVVTDERALLDYVRRTRPDEIVTTEHIRESFRTHLLGMAKDQLTTDEHGGLVVDKNGEVIPGLALDYGTPRYVPTINADGRRVLGAALSRLLDDARRTLAGDAPREVEP